MISTNLLNDEKYNEKESKTKHFLYEKWTGSNFFFYNGILFLGSQSFRPFIFTSSLITLPVVLFICFNYNFLKDNFTIAIFIILIVLTIVENIILFISGVQDPGVLKRNKCSSLLIHDKQIKVIHKGYYKVTKLCITCNIAKPFRSAHCGDCDNCVQRFDHHCPWIGSCVAKRNYIFFYFFLLVLNLNNFMTLVFACLKIYMTLRDNKNNNDNKDEANSESLNISNNSWIQYSLIECIPSLFIVVYILVTLIFITSLFFYHTSLIIKNMTTKEEVKKLLSSRIGNCYDKGISKNCSDFCNRRNIFPILYVGKELRQEVKDEPKKKIKCEIMPHRNSNKISEENNGFDKNNRTKDGTNSKNNSYHNKMSKEEITDQNRSNENNGSYNKKSFPSNNPSNNSEKFEVNENDNEKCKRSKHFEGKNSYSVNYIPGNNINEEINILSSKSSSNFEFLSMTEEFPDGTYIGNKIFPTSVKQQINLESKVIGETYEHIKSNKRSSKAKNKYKIGFINIPKIKNNSLEKYNIQDNISKKFNLESNDTNKLNKNSIDIRNMSKNRCNLEKENSEMSSSIPIPQEDIIDSEKRSTKNSNTRKFY